MSTDPTTPWAEAMTRVRAVDPRNGRPSWNRLAELSGVSTSTITSMVAGKRRASETTIAKVASALRIDAAEVSGWLGLDRVVHHPYEPPAESALLTTRQRKALTELIRAFTSDEQKDDDHDHTSSMYRAGVRPAEVDDMPELTDQEALRLAALRGEKRGQKAAEAQDREGEAPDPEPGDTPA